MVSGSMHVNVDDACVADNNDTNREGIVKAYGTAIDEKFLSSQLVGPTFASVQDMVATIILIIRENFR